LALNGQRPDAVKWEAVGNQHSAVSHKPRLFTAKVAKDAKKEGNSTFLFSFAHFAPVAVKLLLIAEC